MSDTKLRQAVIDELRIEPSIDDTHIGVAVERGVVTLTGHVRDYMQKTAAERCCWQIKGVRAIAQELEVQPAGVHLVTDESIGERAVASLLWNAWVPANAVHVKVSKGWVTLTGKVDWNYARMAAESAVRKLAGVTGVSNLIALKQHASTTEIKRNVNDALARRTETKDANIDVIVLDDGLVRLQGEVDSWDQQQLIERAVWATAGVRALEDDIRIR